MLLLIRHGESEWNAVRRWQGQADSPLSSIGRRQAQGVADRLAAHDPPARFATVWTSDLGRARETAQVLAPAVGVDEVHADARLREAEAGPWEGLTPDEIERTWPGWLSQNRRPDGFEPAEVLLARALDVCDDLFALAADPAGGRPVLAVTHSGVIRTLRRHLGVVDLRVPNLGGVWLTRAVDGGLRPLGWFDGTMRPAAHPAPDPSPSSRPPRR